MSQENVERLRNIYEEWAKGNFRVGGELLDDDVVFRGFEIEADDLVVQGKDAVRDFMRRFLQQWDGLTMEARNFTISDDKVLVDIHQSARGRLSGAGVEMDLSHVWTLRGGRATEVRALRNRQEALEAAGLRE